MGSLYKLLVLAIVINRYSLSFIYLFLDIVIGIVYSLSIDIVIDIVYSLSMIRNQFLSIIRDISLYKEKKNKFYLQIKDRE